MIRVAIVDDEKNARESLRILLTSFLEGIEVIGEAASALDARTLIKETSPDLVFLDIRMPGGSGFTFLESLENPSFEVVFTTGHREYAMDAIRHEALDYLLKPYELADLKRALERFEKRKENRIERKGREELEKDRIALPVHKGYKMVEIRDIVFCEASGSYAHVHCREEKILVARKLKFFEELFKQHSFCRVHDGYLINMDWLDTYQSGKESKVILKTGESIPVSRGRKKSLLEVLKIG